MSPRTWFLVLPGTVLVVAATSFAMIIAGRSLGTTNATLAMALSPVVVAVCLTLLTTGGESSLTARLWPGLAGLTGLLLLLPAPRYSDWRTWLGLASLPLFLGIGATLFAGAVPHSQSSEFAAAAVGLLVAGTLYIALWRRGSPGAELSMRISLQAAGLDGLTALLSLLTLARLGAVRWSAQFLLSPLLTLCEGVVFLRPILDGRSMFGMALIAVGAGYQIFMSPAEVSTGLVLGLLTPLPAEE